MQPVSAEAYTISEIAIAARVPVTRVQQAIRASGVSVSGKFVSGADAVALVRAFRRGGAIERPSAPLTLLPQKRPRRVGPLVLSATLHGLMLALLIAAASLGLLNAKDTEEKVIKLTPTRLVYLKELGPGGGGGGGGMKMPEPAPRPNVKPQPNRRSAVRCRPQRNGRCRPRQCRRDPHPRPRRHNRNLWSSCRPRHRSRRQ